MFIKMTLEEGEEEEDEKEGREFDNSNSNPIKKQKEISILYTMMSKERQVNGMSRRRGVEGRRSGNS